MSDTKAGPPADAGDETGALREAAPATATPTAATVAASTDDAAGPPPPGAEPRKDDRDGESGFPIVGIGASAGGLEALEQLLGHMPPRPGMAFVIITHQHPGHTSLMPELLGRKTTMPVLEVSEPTALERDHIYTVKPGHDAAISKGVLLPSATTRHALYPMPVDYFFRSLAQDQGERAVGVVLSGTGSDGTLGAKEINSALGLVIAQDEATAQYQGMPHSAIATGIVDLIVPAAEIPGRLVEHAHGLAQGLVRQPAEAPSSGELAEICQLLRSRTGHDFSQYKDTTVRRRIERRVALHRLESTKRYVSYIKESPTELDLLFKELLIGVTSFFRDPEAWESLGTALRALVTERSDDQGVRAWVAGCSTGEEAYSVAILLREILDEVGRPLAVQIFATDIDPEAIEIARAGLYDANIANDVSSRRLGRFFAREEGGSFRVRKEIREMVVFAPQDIIGDPPFTKLDVLCCRNVLIYLNASIQQKLIPIFHYALNPGGILFLGSSETVGVGDLFSPTERRSKIYQRAPGSAGAYAAGLALGRLDAGGTPRRAALAPGEQATLSHLVERSLLRDLVPPTVIVRERGDLVHIHGRTGLFLEPAPGPLASANIFNMAREGLAIGLAAAIRQAAAERREVIHRGVRVRTNGDFTNVDLRVEYLTEPEPLQGLLRIAFVNAAPVAPAAETEREADGPPPDRVNELERELQYTRESHQATIEELEAANEELKSTNEELQSTNEELQSANEELETSKEEMQSLNEELQTVNAELQRGVDELSHANDDMRNLLNSTDIGTIFLDDDLKIMRFTDQAKRVIPLIPSDVGRFVGDLTSTLRHDRLVDDAREVLRTLVLRETEVQGANGSWYLMRILPYRTMENVIRGLVVTFVDVTTARVLQQEQRRLLEALKGSPTTVFVNDPNLRYTWVGGGAFRKNRATLEGKTDGEVFDERTAEALSALKKRALESKSAVDTELDLSLDGRERRYRVYVEPLMDAGGEIVCLTCAATAITPLAGALAAGKPSKEEKS